MSGYLILAEALWESKEYATAWNFGPADDESQPVRWLVERVQRCWPTELRWDQETELQPHEAQSLRVDSSRARTKLGWRPAWDLDEAIDRTVAWYQAFEADADMRTTTQEQIESFSKSQPRLGGIPA